MLISDTVAALIEQLLDDGEGKAEIRRSELASRVGCAPSQINYVITSRFTPERGYLIESRRGGGGYIRIMRKEVSRNQYLMHCLYAAGDELDEGAANAILRNLQNEGLISGESAALAAASMSQAALQGVPTPLKKAVRADIFRQIILSLMK